MRNRSHPRLAVALCLAATLAANPAEARDETRLPERDVVETDPARAAQQALAPIVFGGARSVEIAIDSPAEGTIFSDAPVAHLTGSLAALGRIGRVDAIVVIDTSLSTTRMARRREPGRERIRGRDDPWRREPASVLQHEIRSAELLLSEIDPRNTRIGIVSFSGTGEGEAPDPERSARTVVPLTGGLEALDAGLQRVAGQGSRGRTDMASGLDRAVAELAGRGDSRPDPDAAKVIVFFTDGTPTLPHDDLPANEQTVFEAADRAAAAGIRVFSFAIGPEALRRPAAAVEMARRTDGVYTPVREPHQLAETVAATVEFTEVGGELRIENATLQANARDLHVGEGGVFGGLVPLSPGRNEIHVRAVAGDVEIRATRLVHYAPGSFEVFRPPERRILPVPTVTTRRELELGAGQQRTIDLTLGDGPRKEIEIGIGPAGARPR